MLLEAYQKKFDLVVFWRLDRFSREGALATLRYLKELKDHGVNYKSFTEPYLDSLGSFGDVIVSLLATIAAQDLLKISENTKAALAKKKAAGIKLGTPGKSQAQIEQIRRLKGGGMSNYAIGKSLGISARVCGQGGVSGASRGRLANALGLGKSTPFYRSAWPRRALL
ncbi:MAG: recombinase family protein [Hymenobacter sp.]|nr:MAG: recombinase family protein [Hymenobacter sp.]